MAVFAKDQKQQPGPAADRPQSRPHGHSISVIGPDLVVDGTIGGNENLMIEGTVKGRIDMSSDLRVGTTARVEASVHARNVAIEGTVVGDVSADQKIELVASARVDGNIKAPKIVVAEGAKFRGAVDMGAVEEQ